MSLLLSRDDLRRWICALFAFMFASGVAASGQPIAPVTIAVFADKDDMDDYRTFLADRPVEEISFYGGPGARRDVIEMVLFQQQLILGGIDAEIEFVQELSHRRIMQQIRLGRVISYVNSVWDVDIDEFREDYFISEPVIRNGEFIVGFYTHPNNHRAQAAQNIKALRELEVVSNRQWPVDWKTLNGLGFSKLHDTFLWANMVRMVAAPGRIDMTLAPFQASEDMSLDYQDLRLIPVPNVRVALMGQRHWVVSRAHPRSGDVYKALEKGLAMMRKDQRIVRAFQESGFFDQRVKDWPVINAQLAPTL